MCLSASTIILFNNSALENFGGYRGGVKCREDVDSLFYYVQLVGEQKGWDTVERICLAAYQIVKNHVFWDANKRTATLVILNCLKESGYSYTGRPKDLADQIIELAASPPSKKDEAILKLSYFLKRHLQKK
jgi:death-on-curing protein